MKTPAPTTRTAAVVVGGSAGAIDALAQLLGALPATFALPVVVVTHLARQRPSHLANALAAHCRLPVREIEDKEPLAAGTVHVAPPDYHLLIDVGPRLALTLESAVRYSIPSIDVLFESAADAFGAALAGVVLSGANDDGARGLVAIVRAGGTAFVQAPADAVMATMPEAAIAACPTATVLGARDLGGALARLDPASEASA